LKKIIGIILTITLLISCKNSEKSETENNSKSEFKTDTLQLEFKRLGNKHTVDLEYLFLDENEEQIEFSSINKIPEFPGGLDSLTKFIQQNYKFEHNDDEYIEGKVKTTFAVDTIGKVVDIEIIESLRKDYDSACYKVIAKIPDWKPAELNDGKKVKTKFLLPFKFVLEE
tara:strand:- start:6395 stop:6904 length:510 start_codon:yes stop_codon:yes gene_type:complete